MKNVIIDAGIVPHKWVKKALEDTQYGVFFVGDDKDIDSLEKDITGIKPLRYTELVKRNVYKNLPKVQEQYNKIFNSLLSDNRTTQISERTFPTLLPWNNHLFSQIPLISEFVCAYIDYIEEIKPEFVFFQAAPHNLYTFVFGRVAELMGIKVYLSKTTVLPWKSNLVCGIDEQKICPVRKEFTKDNEDRLEGYFSMNSKKYDEAIPSYEKVKLEARKGKFWSWSSELKEAFHSPHRIVAVLRKYKLYKFYQSISTTDINVGKYIMVFLHFQPERTSLPEGLFFAQQSHLIRTLSLGVPDDYTILVKEHPNMFVYSLDIRYRNKWFYEDIASMKNVKLVDIEIDSFTLSDQAKCIATITGTVGMQALNRGKAVLAFGVAAYRDFRYCYQIFEVEDVKRSIAEIDGLTPEEISSRYKDYLKESNLLSANGIDEDYTGNIDYYNQEYRLNADGKVLYSLLCHE